MAKFEHDDSLDDSHSSAWIPIVEGQEEGGATQEFKKQNERVKDHASNETSTASLEGLSNDILAWLLSHLTVTEIATVSLVSKRLKEASRQSLLWQLKFGHRWNIDAKFQVAVSNQNWYLAYQQAYHNPHDVWLFHWNCTYPQDGLVPGRCCIYHDGSIRDINNRAKENKHENSIKEATETMKNWHDLCPSCRFFPDHPLKIFRRVCNKAQENEQDDVDSIRSTADRIARATDRTLRDFCQHHGISEDAKDTMSYSIDRAQQAFAQAATFHRILDTQQYAVARARGQVESTPTYMTFLKDLLFFNVTEQPLFTQRGKSEVNQLRQDREAQQAWQEGPSSRPTDRRNLPEFWKPAYETSHHSWHQVLLANPDFTRPIVFRVSIQRPDCFVVFPSEGFLEAGQSTVLTFGVRPLGSLVATAFDEINVQRQDADEHLAKVFQEEGPLPCTPFVLQYKYSSVIPCIPARGFISPHIPQPRAEDPTVVTNDRQDADPGQDDSNNFTAPNGSQKSLFPAVADVCWQQKQMIDFHWSGGDPNQIMVETHEVRSVYLSAHVNAHYSFHEFCSDTLTPFDLTIEPKTKPTTIKSLLSAALQKRTAASCRSAIRKRGQQSPSQPQANRQPLEDLPMLYFAAPHLHEFYPTNAYPLLQQVQLETETSHAGHAFRSHRQKCSRCLRPSWGPRLEEIGQAYVLAKLESLLWQQRQKKLLQNCQTIIRALHAQYQKLELDGVMDQQPVLRAQQLLYVTLSMIVQYRSVPNLNWKLRSVLAALEMVADDLYGIFAYHRSPRQSEECIPWRMSGNYRYRTCTDSVFSPGGTLTEKHSEGSKYAKDDENDMNSFRYLWQTPGRFHLNGPQEDPNHLGELVPDGRQRQKGFVTDMFMDDPMKSFQSALITLYNPRSVSVHGIYDRVMYPGKVVRRPKFPLWVRNKGASESSRTQASPRKMNGRDVYYMLQDTLDLERLVGNSSYLTYSLRRYLHNVPPLGLGLSPLCIDDGTGLSARVKKQQPNEAKEGNRDGQTIEEEDREDKRRGKGLSNSIASRPASRIIPLPMPVYITDKNAISSASEASSDRQTNEPLDQSNADAGVADNNIDVAVARMPGGNPPLLRGPGPRLLNLLWAISAQLGWAVDDPSQAASSVVVNRQLLIGLQWFSVALMAAPVFWSLCARAAHWVPCKPVEYQLEDLPYQLNSEMRFLSEYECVFAAIVLFVSSMCLGRWTERWTGRDFSRAMLEHTTSSRESTTFVQRLLMRYKRRWDSICPLFLQRMIYVPDWNRRSVNDLLKHIAFWKSHDLREHRSHFNAAAGSGIMFWSDRWREIRVANESVRKLLFASIAALASFSSSTPHFWVNLLTVFCGSISLGLSVSLQSLEHGTNAAASRSVAAFLESLNLVTLLILSFLLGQLLGSSGGILFLAEFVVTSISFILGGAGTISASSVECWATFFCLSSTAFWGYLFGRVALMDGIIRQKRLVKSNIYSMSLLCASLAVALVLWIVVVLWRWDVPVSLMMLRPNMMKTAGNGASGASAASRKVAGSAAAEYARKHLQ